VPIGRHQAPGASVSSQNATVAKKQSRPIPVFLVFIIFSPLPLVRMLI
jgi:hypothetical protein